jgi:hypothetical protein
MAHPIFLKWCIRVKNGPLGKKTSEQFFIFCVSKIRNKGVKKHIQQVYMNCLVSLKPFIIGKYMVNIEMLQVVNYLWKNYFIFFHVNKGAQVVQKN